MANEAVDIAWDAVIDAGFTASPTVVSLIRRFDETVRLAILEREVDQSIAPEWDRFQRISVGVWMDAPWTDFALSLAERVRWVVLGDLVDDEVSFLLGALEGTHVFGSLEPIEAWWAGDRWADAREKRRAMFGVLTALHPAARDRPELQIPRTASEPTWQAWTLRNVARLPRATALSVLAPRLQFIAHDDGRWVLQRASVSNEDDQVTVTLRDRQSRVCEESMFPADQALEGFLIGRRFVDSEAQCWVATEVRDRGEHVELVFIGRPLGSFSAE